MITENSYDSKEREFVRRLNYSDERAWGEMFDRFDPLIISMAQKCLPSKCIDDIVQNVHLQLFRTISRYDPARSALVTWVMLLTKRNCIDQLRKNRRDRAQFQLEDVITASNLNYKNDYEIAEDGPRAMACIDRLSKTEYREILNLVYKQGLTIRVAAETLEVPLGTAKTHLSRGLSEIRKQFEKENREEGHRVSNYS